MANALTFSACRLDSYATARFAELCRAASKQTQLKIAPHHVSTYEELAEHVRTSPNAIAWAPPIVAVELLDAGVAHVVALPERHGLLTSNVAFVVRSDDRAASLESLRNRRVMWLDRRSASGYVIPRLHLWSQGHDPDKFFATQAFGDTHLAMLDAVSSGAADVGTSWCRVDPSTRELLDAGWIRSDGLSIRPVRVAATIGPVPNDAILVSNKVAAVDRSALARWLLEPDTASRAPLKDLLNTHVFRTPSSAHFKELRHMLRASSLERNP